MPLHTKCLDKVRFGSGQGCSEGNVGAGNFEMEPDVQKKL